MWTLVCVSVAGPLDRHDLYEELYRAGYGSEGFVGHMVPLVQEVERLGRANVGSVLDVGTSHGGAVKMLWERGYTASGVDISETAVAMAQRRHGHPSEKCVQLCWQAASAVRLPFSNKSVDAIVSSDVLEHLEPQDVPEAVAEFSRVARKYLILKISNRKESMRMDKVRAPGHNGTFANVVRARGHELPENLHASIHGRDWWVDAFAAAGWRLLRPLPLPSWACCGFVLHTPSATPP